MTPRHSPPFYDASVPDNQFITPSLQSQCLDLLQALHRLQTFIGLNFHCLRGRSAESGIFLYPDLNIDRGGSGEPEQMARYDRFADELHDLIEAAEQQYLTFRKAIKHSLAV